MRKVFSANFAKVAVIAVALAVAATCTVAGTLAAFSATYTWNAETATGSAYSDTDYSLDLFGGRTIMPGDSGSAVLGGPDFGDSVVEWSLSVGGVGDKSVPVVFYVKDAEGNLYQNSFYSSYAFSDGLSASWIDCEGNGISLGSVDDNPISIASRLGVGRTLCWVWPKAFYTSDALEEELADEQTEEYSAYCASVMSAEYGFTAAHAEALNAVDAQAFVVSTDGDVLNAVSGAVSGFSVRDGLFVMHGRTVNAEQSGNFFVPDHAFELSADSAVWVLVSEKPETPAASTEKTLQENGISFEKGDLYEFSNYDPPESGTGTVDITATPNAEGNRRLYRIFPSASGGMSAKISVTVTAVVGW